MFCPITAAANHAIKNKRIHKIANVSDKQKKSFLNKNSFKCKPFGLKITAIGCKKYQKVAATAKPWEPANKCKECKKYNKKLAETMESKKCLLETIFPGYCSGSVDFKRPISTPKATWEDKQCCSTKCSGTLSNFKNAGYKSINDISKKRRNNLMIVDMRIKK